MNNTSHINPWFIGPGFSESEIQFCGYSNLQSPWIEIVYDLINLIRFSKGNSTAIIFEDYLNQNQDLNGSLMFHLSLYIPRELHIYSGHEDGAVQELYNMDLEFSKMLRDAFIMYNSNHWFKNYKTRKRLRLCLKQIRMFEDRARKFIQFHRNADPKEWAEYVRVNYKKYGL